QGDLRGAGRRPPRGASCRPQRRPPSPLGRRSRRQHDLGLRPGAGPGAPEGRAHHRLLRQGQRRRGGPAHVLRPPGPHAHHGALQPRHNYAFTTAALKSKIWLIEQQDDGTFKASDVADIANPMDVPLPVDISLSADDRFLFVDTFMDGTCRVYDVSDPHQPKLVLTEKIGSQVNMVSETWDGKRVYFTSSLLANWDKTGKDNEQFLKAYGWDGNRLTA